MTDVRRAAEESVRELVEWAASLTFDDIPDDVKQRAALVVADDLASAVASRNEPEVQKLAEHLPAGLPEATVFLGHGMLTDRASAAMINAIATNWCQLDEGHRTVMCHAGLYAVPAAAAEAEAGGHSARDVLRAVVISYEIVCRFAQTWSFRRPTVHPHAAWSSLGATTAVAALRRLNASAFLDALTSSVTMALAGPFEHGIRGALIQNTWAGVGAWTGFRCVDWAGCGITGLASSPFDVLFTVLSAETDAAALTAGLGKDWALRGGYHKIYSCAQQSHAAVEATLRLVKRWPDGKGPDNVARLVVEGHRLALTMDNRNPPTTLAARFSLPHIVAAVCVLGRADVEAFAASTLDHPDIIRIREMIELRLYAPEMPWPHDRPARVTMMLDDGPTLVEECLSAEGGPDRPFPAEAILKKCAGLTRGLYPAFRRISQGLYEISDHILAEDWKKVVLAMYGE